MLATNPVRIIVVDDDANARNALVDLFEEIGYVVYPAEDGVDALELLSRTDPHIVLTDLQMPRLDGVSLIRKGKLLAPRTHFVVMTAYDAPHSLEVVLRAGACSYLVKPLDLPTVERVIGAVLDRAGAEASKELVR